MIAEIPSVIIISFKKGTATSISLPAEAGGPDSRQAKKINSKKDMLQRTASFEKNDIIFIEYTV